MNTLKNLNILLIGSYDPDKQCFIKELLQKHVAPSIMPYLLPSVVTVCFPEFTEYDCFTIYTPSQSTTIDYNWADAYICMLGPGLTVSEHYHVCQSKCPNKPIVLCYNTSDTPKTINDYMHEGSNRYQYIPISVKNKINILEPFRYIVNEFKNTPEVLPQAKRLNIHMLTMYGDGYAYINALTKLPGVLKCSPPNVTESIFRLPQIPGYEFRIITSNFIQVGLKDVDACIIMYQPGDEHTKMYNETRKVFPTKHIVLFNSISSKLFANDSHHGMNFSGVSMNIANESDRLIIPLLNIVESAQNPDKCETTKPQVAAKLISLNGYIYNFACKLEYADNFFDPEVECGAGYHGLWTKKVADNNLLVEETMYCDGYRHGLSVKYPDKSKAVYSPTIKKTMYERGQRHGSDTVYYTHAPNKIKEQKNYKNGILHGQHIKFTESGVKILDQNWNEGVRDGLCSEWYPNGNPKSSITFKNGIKSGKFNEWHQNGCTPKLCAEYTTSNPGYQGDNPGYKSGTWKYYDENGVLFKTIEYGTSIVYNEKKRRLESIVLKVTHY